jgi:putative chitinase
MNFEIGVRELIVCGIPPTQARLFALPVAEACRAFEIDTKVRFAAFMAQTGHESADFTRTEESLYYTRAERIRQIWPSRVRSLQEAAELVRRPQALANRVYSNRLGNGDEASGEGWKYRGRGLIQLTGRSNYKIAGEALGTDYLAKPELVALPPDACFTAAWFWSTRQCNVLADAALIDAITHKVNGPAMVGADDRRSRFDEAMLAL